MSLPLRSGLLGPRPSLVRRSRLAGIARCDGPVRRFAEDPQDGAVPRTMRELMAEVEQVFREASDLFVLIATDRRIKVANPAMREAVRGARPGADFLDLVPENSKSRLATELARAAGGSTVLVEVDHARL